MGSNRNIANIRMGRRAHEQENLPHNWENIDINNFQVPKAKSGKIIFEFCGNNATRNEAGNGEAKITQALLPPDKVDSTDIYSFVYNGEPIKSGGRYLLAEYEDDAKLLYEKVFKPMLFDSKGYIKSNQGVEAVFDSFILSAHCGGANFANIIIEGFNKTLHEHFPKAMAELLTNKIQYIAYAPNELPNHNVNALLITPSVDPSCSWSKAIEFAGDHKVDIDYPKGIVKKLLSARQSEYADQLFARFFDKTRAIMFRVGNSTYYMPGPMNPNKRVGDHSRECLVRDHILNSGTDYAETARMTNAVARRQMAGFLGRGMFDAKGFFSEVSVRLDKNKPKDPSIM